MNADSLEFKDRSTGLTVFGIIEIMLGALAGLLMLVAGLGMTFAMQQQAAGVEAKGILIGLLMYGAIAAFFIILGIGSIRARRWARAIWLIVSWFWLLSGLMGTVMLVSLVPDMYQQMADRGEIPQEMVMFMKIFVFAIAFAFYVVLPTTFLLFYRSRHVKATCEARNPDPCWTDACPLPVLAVSLLLGLWGVVLLFIPFYGGVMPFFGTILSGLGGILVALIAVFLCGYLSWRLYQVRLSAWWGSLAFTTIWFASVILTFSRHDLADLYTKMNMPEEQIEMMRSMGMSDLLWWSAPWFVLTLGYLLYVKRFFPSEQFDDAGAD